MGLGSARSGTDHFWRQRISAVALVPLSIWFVIGAVSLVGANIAEVLVFLGEPINAILMFLFLFAALTHMTLGVQVVIEDYVHGERLKLLCLMLNRFFALGVGFAAGFALLKIAL
nr:MAG: succinate dehydrogenase, hydrophobic membrane anchor protein [Hyphomicrobiales bacterium]